MRRERDRLAQQIAQKDDEIREIKKAWNEAELEARKNARKAKSLSDRAHAGVCPCCNRTFKQLAAHMKTKHPDETKLKAVG